MNFGHGLGLLAAVFIGAIASWKAARPQSLPVGLVVSHAGRDQALVHLLQSAQKSVFLRTGDLTLIPAGNELAQAVQRDVSVTVELPMDAGLNLDGSRLPRLLMALGAVVTFRSDPAGNYRGTHLEVDGERFLYSASPLTLNPPGAMVSYVAGPIQR